MARLGGDGMNGDVNIVGGSRVLSASDLAALTNIDDGEEVYLQADALTPETLWRLRYNAAISPYPWQFVGGPPVIAEVGTSESMTNGSYNTWRSATQSGLTIVGPRIVLPVAGKYDAEWGAMIDGAAAGTRTSMGLNIDGVDPANPSDPWIANYDIRFESLAGKRRIEVTGTLVVLAKYLREESSAATAGFSKRWLSILPVNIG